jgi:hypothetical protein
MALDATSRPARAFDVRSSTLGESLILVRDRDAFELSATEQVIWSACDGTKTLKDIAGLVAAEYDVEEAVALDDAKAFVTDLADAGLVDI